MRRYPACTDQQGASTLEFALLLPPFIFLVIGMLEMCMIMFVSMSMDVALDNTARTGSTGYVASGQTQQQTIIATMNQYLGGMIDTTQLSITTTSYSDLNQIGVNGQGTSGLGTANQYVVYNVSYPWHLMTPLLDEVVGTNGVYTITVQTLVKNEPYGT